MDGKIVFKLGSGEILETYNPLEATAALAQQLSGSQEEADHIYYVAVIR